MKKIILCSILFSLTAAACPDLKGNYKVCISRMNGRTLPMHDVKVKQYVRNNFIVIMKYNLWTKMKMAIPFLKLIFMLPVICL